ncbi:hypothetical protein TSOC_014748, partial [Tetrabaena socialis]
EAVRRRSRLQEAGSKVPPDSSWLDAYSNTLRPRQLTFRLGKRASQRALLEGWALYEPKFDTVAMAALLRRLRVAQLHDPDFDPPAVQALLTQMEARLRAVSLRYGRLRDITAYCHALAKLSSPPPPPVRQQQRGAAEPAAADAGGGAAAAAAATRTAAAPPLTQSADLLLDLAAWATRERVAVLQAGAQRVATLLWALARLLPEAAHGDERLQMVLDRIALCHLPQLANFAPLDLRVFAVAYAAFGAGGDGGAVTGRSAGVAWPEMPGKQQQREQQAQAQALQQQEALQQQQQQQQEQEKQEAGGEAGDGAEAVAVVDVAEAARERRRARNARVLQAVSDELVARYGNLAVPQPEARDMALAAAAAVKVAAATAGGTAASAAAPPPYLPLLAKAAAAAAAAPPHALRPAE